MSRGTVSRQTRNNWLIDAAVFTGAIFAAITGIYFLFLPSGGFQGGRNPWYGVTILFERATWDTMHTWGGVLMIAAAAIHFAFHWQWVKSMATRIARTVTGRSARLNRNGYVNLAVDAIIAVSFLLAAISGIYFMFVTGNRWSPDPMIVFSRLTWDLIHTWSGVTMIVAAVIHFAIHWRWATKVTRKVLGSLVPDQGARSVTAPLAEQS